MKIINFLKSFLTTKKTEKQPEVKQEVTPEPRRKGPLHAYRMDK
jgi:hypothetical protein